ncbi:hypothetical protein AAHA92_10108 [Salvia divinorum]|uniref:Uncharacterized protein n=1 Tax=Salvia divinorum TaxID=28513 RepID=A0ABD1HX55_SALDI
MIDYKERVEKARLATAFTSQEFSMTAVGHVVMRVMRRRQLLLASTQRHREAFILFVHQVTRRLALEVIGALSGEG